MKWTRWDFFRNRFHSPSFFLGLAIGLVLSISVLIDSKGAKRFEISQTSKQECPPSRKVSSIDDEALPPPQFAEDLPQVIETNIEGDAKIKWEKVKHALEYRIFVKDESGNVVKKFKVYGTTATLKELPAPQNGEAKPYFVSMASLNVEGKMGEEGKVRKILVKRPPSIMAPRIVTIRAED